MKFEIIGRIADVEVIASGSGVRVRRLLRKAYGSGRWRKLKGIATVRLPNGKVYRILPDAKAARDNLVRIVDESGEDYLYDKSHFVFVDFPKAVARKILALQPIIA